MKTQLVTITPAMAENWLNENNAANRKLREGLAEKYAADMRSGHWTECPVPISFYDDGNLADGQHRLFAIVESGIAQQFLVLYGLPRKAGLNLDNGAVRTLVDNARIAGNAELNNTLLAVTRAIYEGERQHTAWSNAAKMDMVEKFGDYARWAMQYGPKGKHFRTALVLAAVARAYMHGEDPTKLERFSAVMSTGFSDGTHESAAVAIRNYLQSRPDRIQADWRSIFLKVQNAIAYFLKDKPLVLIKSVSEECFPLPSHLRPPQKQKKQVAVKTARRDKPRVENIRH